MSAFAHIPFSALHPTSTVFPRTWVWCISNLLPVRARPLRSRLQPSPCQPRTELWGRGHTIWLLRKHPQVSSRDYLESHLMWPPAPLVFLQGLVTGTLTWAVSPCGQVCLIGVTDKHVHTCAHTHMLLKATRFILTTPSYHVLLRYVAYTIIYFSMNTDSSTCRKYEILLLYVKSGVSCFNTQYYYYMLNQEYHGPTVA